MQFTSSIAIVGLWSIGEIEESTSCLVIVVAFFLLSRASIGIVPSGVTKILNITQRKILRFCFKACLATMHIAKA